MHACKHACMHACMRAYIHTYIHTHTYVRVYIYIYILVVAKIRSSCCSLPCLTRSTISLYIYIYIYIYACTHTYAYMHIRIFDMIYKHQRINALIIKLVWFRLLGSRMKITGVQIQFFVICRHPCAKHTLTCCFVGGACS